MFNLYFKNNNQARSGGLAYGGEFFLCTPLTVDVHPPKKPVLRKNKV